MLFKAGLQHHLRLAIKFVRGPGSLRRINNSVLEDWCFCKWPQMLELVKLAFTPQQHGLAAYVPHMGWLFALGGLLVGCAAAMASLIT
eukprot:1158992-Pelagomonas_calceolata.AAC.1